MLAVLRNCGGKRVFSECKQNKLQTGQNSHLAVEPAAPAVLCRKKCADYFKYGVEFIYLFYFFLHPPRYFPHYSGVLVNNPTSTINQKGFRRINGKFSITALSVKCHAFWKSEKQPYF